MMKMGNRILVAVIIISVVGIVAWSRLRYADKEVYDQPLRIRVDDHPALRQQ